MDLSALTDDTECAIKLRDLTLIFTLRNPTSRDDLEYRRRSAKVSVKNGKIESSDVALDAPLWLLEQICTKVECHNGTPEDRREMSKEEIAKIPSLTRRRVITQYLLELEGEEAEQVKN
jgi:hypothetical protein